MDHQAIESFQAQAYLYKNIFNYIGSTSLKCAVQLGIPDIIHNHGEPITLSQLVSALAIDSTKATYIYRIMRLLVHLGFFATTKVENDEAYIPTPFSKIILKDNINCLSPFVMLALNPITMAPFQFLGDWLQGTTEVRPFERVHGTPVWKYMDQDPDFKNIYYEALKSDSQMMNLVVKDCKPVFEGLNSLVDVGGGTGAIARVIVKAFPQLKCIVFDLPHAVANQPNTENLNFVGGDMFHHIPSADAILMKLLLHGFDDEDCIKILKKCREAIDGEKGKVIIVDIVINEKKDEHEVTEAKLLFDMLMMVNGTGRERTEQDWKKLFLAAGFNNYKITPLFDLRSLIEVYP